MFGLKLGLLGRASLIVADEHTAANVGSGRIAVLATPVMINLIEAAALNATEDLLPAGFQSLGTFLEVSHTAATPVGMQVVADAELIDVKGRELHYLVKVRDEREKIGGGLHRRVVVNVERFDARVREKSEADRK